jgi:hypothetical protein
MNIYITQEARERLWAFVEAVNIEIGGFGYAFIDKDGDITWTDTFLVPQYSSSSEVDFEGTDGDAVAIEYAAKDGHLGADDFVWVSWHSHHTMKPFWSQTDEKRITGLGKTGIRHLLSFVGCHDHSYRLRLEMFGIEHHGIKMSTVTSDDLKFVADPRDALLKEINAEIKENLLKRPASTYTTKGKKQTDYTKGQPAPARPLLPERTTDPGAALERAMTVRALMEAGLDRADAEYIADEEVNGEYVVGPEGVEWCASEGVEWDELAWGMGS